MISEVRAKMVLADDKYALIPWNQGHVEPLLEAIQESKDDLTKHFAWAGQKYDLEEAQKWIDDCKRWWAKKLNFGFAIFDLHDNFVGSISVQEVNKHFNSASIGYWIRTSRQKEGAATAAGRMVIDFAFNILGLTRLELVSAVHNFPSRQVAARLGFIREGIASNKLVIQGKPVDAAVYGLTPKIHKLEKFRA